MDTFQLQLAVDDAAAVRVARRSAREVIEQWTVRGSVADDACLVISELVTNALMHGRSEAVLRMHHNDDGLLVEVMDQNTRLPVLVAPDPHSLSGRGLALVASLATLWGAEHTPTGKVVWAEFDLTDRRSTAPDPSGRR